MHPEEAAEASAGVAAADLVEVEDLVVAGVEASHEVASEAVVVDLLGVEASAVVVVAVFVAAVGATNLGTSSQTASYLCFKE